MCVTESDPLIWILQYLGFLYDYNIVKLILYIKIKIIKLMCCRILMIGYDMKLPKIQIYFHHYLYFKLPLLIKILNIYFIYCTKKDIIAPIKYTLRINVW